MKLQFREKILHLCGTESKENKSILEKKTNKKWQSKIHFSDTNLITNEKQNRIRFINIRRSKLAEYFVM